MLVLGAPGVALLPVVGLFLALGAFFVGLGLFFKFAVWMSGPCPFCDSVQFVWVPADGLSWGQIRRGRSGRVFGADCVVCRNRIILRVDDRVAVPAPMVVRGAPFRAS